MTATRYKIDGNAVTLRLGGLLHGELEAVHGLHTGVFMTTVGVVGCQYGRVCLSGNDGGCHRVKRSQTLREDTGKAPGRSLPEKGGSVEVSV